MASNLRVDSIVPATGANVSIGTATGGVIIPGVLTYEDVTNVDSVGVVTARTDINLGDSIIHIGDTNTKIRFPAADTITAETGGSEKLRIDSKGQLSSGGSTTAFDGTSSLNGIQMYYETDSGVASFGSYSSGGTTNLRLYTNSGGSAATEKIRITGSGEIGLSGANYGTSGQVLTSQGSGSAVQWATPSSGGFTLLNTTTITNNSTSISLSLSSYQHLYGTVTGLVGASALGDCYLRFNSDSGTNYPWHRTYQQGNEGINSTGDRDATSFYFNGVGFAGWPNSQNVHRFTLFDVNSGARKLFEMFSVGDDPSYSGHPLFIMTHGQYKSTSAITSLQLSGSTAFTGGVVKLYGIK